MDMDFEGLFRLTEQDRSTAILENIFGDIINVIKGGGTLDLDSGSWINTAITFFNIGCLLAAILICLYTILNVVFDTAKDGTTFGQNTDTRYTMLRVIAGGIFFIPVSGGFSVAQIVLLWIIIQGSSLANGAWAQLAANELDGKTFIQPGRIEQNADDTVVRQWMAGAFITLVRGNICAQQFNEIAESLIPPNADASPNPDRSPVRLVLQQQATGNRFFSQTQNGVTYAYFEDSTGAARNTNSLCGSVRYEAPIAYIADPDPDNPDNPDLVNTEFFRLAMSRAAQRRMEVFRSVLTEMNSAAANVASRINSGQTDEDELLATSFTAVDKARQDFISGAIAANTANITEENISDMADLLVEKVSVDGWVMAAAWQRGISRAVSDQRSSFQDFELELNTEINAGRFLSPREANGGLLSRRPATVRAVLSEMELQLEFWDTVSPTLLATTRGRTEGTPTSLANGGSEEMSGSLGSLAELLQDAFSPRGDTNSYSDPMVDITEYGFGLVKIGGIVMISGAVADGAGTIAAFTPARAAAPVLDGLADHVLYPLGWTLLMCGFVVASILPLVPIVYFLSAIGSWLFLVLESMFAVPLAVLSLFTPSRDGTLLGSWNKILLTIFGILLRPLFTIIGLFAAMLVIAIMMDFSYDLFRSMIVMVAPTASILNIVTMLGVVIMSVIVSFYIVLLGSQLITQIGDSAMGWLGIGIGAGANAMNVAEPAIARAGVAGALPGAIRGPKMLSGEGGSKGRTAGALQKFGSRGPSPAGDKRKLIGGPRGG